MSFLILGPVSDRFEEVAHGRIGLEVAVAALYRGLSHSGRRHQHSVGQFGRFGAAKEPRISGESW